MRMALRRVLTDITDMLRMRVLLMGTMARHGLAVGCLLAPAHGSGTVMATMAAAMDMVIAASTGMVEAMGMDMGMDMVTVMVTDMATHTGTAAIVAVTDTDTAAASMAVVMVTGNFSS